MSKIIVFLKKQKLFIFLFFILITLLIIRLILTPKTKLETITTNIPSPSPAAAVLFPSPTLTSADNVFYDPVTEALQEVLKKKPWILDLPITSPQYVIDYLGEEGGFRVLMKIDIGSSLSREEQISQIKKEAPEKLEQIGVDLKQEKIYYTFTP